MKRMIKGYLQETDFVNAGAGTATWCIASKDGKKYFIKSFLEVTLVDEETAKNLPAPMVEAKRKNCIQFRVRKERLYNKLNEIQNGIFVTPKELLIHNGHFCAVTDYMESFDKSAKVHKFSPRRKTILMRTMMLAMRDLANNHIVHSDIKPDNIVITYNQKGNPQLKIIDFDSGFFEDAPPHNVNEYHGDMVYFAPESMVFLQTEGESDIRLTCAVDKFAIGLMLHQMWCGMLPTYDTAECANAAEALLLEKPITLHGSIPEKLQTIINGFLQENPDNRMGYDQAYALLGEMLDALPADEPDVVTPKASTKAPNASADIEVRIVCVDTNGTVIESSTLKIAAGSEYTVVPKVLDEYECMDTKRLVRISADGHAEPSSITFRYRRKKSAVWLWLLAVIIVALIIWFFTDGQDVMANQSVTGHGLYGVIAESTSPMSTPTRTATSSPRPTVATVFTGSNSVYVQAGQTVRVKFTASSSGTYIFTSTGLDDTKGYLYSSATSTSELVSDDDTGSGSNFQIERYLSSNETIYVGVKFYSSDKSGSITLNISKKPTRTFEMSSIVSMNRGRVTVSWTDSANNSPYKVLCQYVGVSGITQPNYWAGGDESGSTTYAKSFTIDQLAPGRAYRIEVRDCNNNSIYHTYNLPTPATFEDGKLKASSIKVSISPRQKLKSSDKQSASSISSLRASDIIANRSSKEYGFRYDIDYPQLAYSRNYFTQIVITAPNGYLETEEYRSIDYDSGYSGRYWYMLGEWTFKMLYDKNSVIPTGTWTVELYWDGMFVNRSTFRVN